MGVNLDQNPQVLCHPRQSIRELLNILPKHYCVPFVEPLLKIGLKHGHDGEGFCTYEGFYVV